MGRLLLPGLAGALGIVACGLAAAGDYRVEVMVPPAPLHGANGMQFDARGNLIGGSMMSGTLFSVERRSGAVTTLVEAPRGVADDLAIGPDGSIVWTSPPMGTVSVLRPGGSPAILYRNLPMINSIFFDPGNGKLYAAAVSNDKGDLYELDPEGHREPRVVVAGLPGLNGFEVTKDHVLYGPLMYTGEIIRVDLTTGSVSHVAGGFPRPSAVNLDSHGLIYVVDYFTGEVTRVDPATGARKVIARTDPPVDNLAVSADDLIYVSHPCDNGIEEIDPRSGRVRQVAKGSIGWPGGGALIREHGRETLLIAGLLCNNYIDTATGAVRRVPRQGDTAWSGWLDQRGDTILVSGFAFGELQWLKASTGEPVRTLKGWQAPYQAKLMDDDSVLLVEQGKGRIVRLRPPFTGEPEVVAGNLGGPLGFALEGGELFVTEADAGVVSRIVIASGARTVIRDGLRQPEGIALLPDGRLAVAEVGLRRLIALPKGGGDPQVLAADLPIGLPPFMGPPKTFIPTGVFAGSDGIIYMTSDINHTVLRIRPVP